MAHVLRVHSHSCSIRFLVCVAVVLVIIPAPWGESLSLNNEVNNCPCVLPPSNDHENSISIDNLYFLL